MPPKATKKKRLAKRHPVSQPAPARNIQSAKHRILPSLNQLEQAVKERTDFLPQANEALRESEELFRTFLDHAPNLAFVKGIDGRYLYVNRQFEEVFHLPSRSALGKTDVELFPCEQADHFQAHDRQVLELGQAREVEETALYADGLHASIVLKFPLRNVSGQIYAIGGIVTDITGRKRAEEALREQDQALRRSREESHELAGRLLTAQDNERHRIARDLHDDYNQRLAAVAIDLQALSQSIPDSLREAQGQISAIQKQVETLSDDIHNLAYQLHSTLLDDVGLEIALRDLIVSFRQREGIEATFIPKQVPAKIPKAVAGCLYRVSQESLRNVEKHAKASAVTVTLSGSHLGLGLSVRDTGRGFVRDQTQLPNHNGLGLGSMQERLRHVNGAFNVHSRPGHGTKICAWVPLPKCES